MTIFAVQYFDTVPDVASIPLRDVQARLRSAFERLPISLLLLGWNLPDGLVNTCAEECQRADCQLYRWQPLLTGDGTLIPKPEWHTIGLNGNPIPGFQGKAEFTFVCPNRPAARQAVLSRLTDILQDDRYQGLFLDRIRYPSPAVDPERALGCFCESCQRRAAEEGFDLENARHRISRLVMTQESISSFIRILLNPASVVDPESDLGTLARFMQFRMRSITDFVQEVSKLIHKTGKYVGLDCFSSSLAQMVGQALGALSDCSDWIKIMSYGHTFGPASLPFELLGLADWLIRSGATEADALAWLSEATRLQIPQTRSDLRKQGLSPEVLQREVLRAREVGVKTLLAGIELVEIAGVAELRESQIAANLQAYRGAGVDGLALSWDLWHIPLERLDIVRTTWQ